MVLSSLDHTHWSLGLERVSAALERLAHPEKSFTAVLVGGTNGKGSTCLYLERLLLRGGVRVGATMSPHVSSFAERFRLQGHQAEEELLNDLEQELRPVLDDLHLTYFEWCVVLAVCLFAREGVQVGVFEIGLGGRYDAANVLDPAVSVITAVDLDHTAWLGDTVGAIAGEKAAIARPGRPLITTTTGEAYEVISRHARDIGACCERPLPEKSLNILTGEHQRMNAAAALAAARHLGIEPSAGDLDWVFATAFLPGRIELVGRRLILDVAHNPASMLRLVNYLEEIRFAGAGILGILKDKDYPTMVEMLQSFCDPLYLVPVHDGRSWGEEEMRACVSGSRVQMRVGVAEAFAELLDGGMPLVIAGSFHTVGEVREQIICRG